MSDLVTGTSSPTVFIDDAGIYYKCWCGTDHRGDYGLNDWLMHHCEHASGLMTFTEPEDGLVICVDCGKVFHLQPPAPPVVEGEP